MLITTLALILCSQAAREVNNPFDFHGIEKAGKQFLDWLKTDDWLTPAPSAQNIKSRRDIGSATPPYVASSMFQEYTTSAAFDSVGSHYLELLRKRAIETGTPESFLIGSQLTIQDSGRIRSINW